MELLNFENSIINAFSEFKPNYIAEYIYNLCVLMNAFYQNNHISNLEDINKLNDWVSVIRLANNIVRESLGLLAIEIPSEM